jgi:hypothetical protein
MREPKPYEIEVKNLQGTGGGKNVSLYISKIQCQKLKVGVGDEVETWISEDNIFCMRRKKENETG